MLKSLWFGLRLLRNPVNTKHSLAGPLDSSVYAGLGHCIRLTKNDSDPVVVWVVEIWPPGLHLNLLERNIQVSVSLFTFGHAGWVDTVPTRAQRQPVRTWDSFQPIRTPCTPEARLAKSQSEHWVLLRHDWPRANQNTVFSWGITGQERSHVSNWAN